MFDNVVEDIPLYKDSITFLNDFYKEYGDEEFKNMIGYLNELITQIKFNRENIDTFDIYLIKLSKKNTFKVITIDKKDIEEKNETKASLVLTAIKDILKTEKKLISVYTDMKGLQEAVYVQNYQDFITVH